MMGCPTYSMKAATLLVLAGDDQRHRILGHGMTNIARRFWPGAEFLRQSAIGGRAAPSDPPRRSIDLLEERVLILRSSLKPELQGGASSKRSF
jgi:hypothetical protein